MTSRGLSFFLRLKKKYVHYVLPPPPPEGMGLEFARRLAVRCEATKQFRTASVSQMRVFKSVHTQQWSTMDAEIKGPPGGSPGLAKVPSF